VTHDGDALSGVTISATSPTNQGEVTAVSSNNGYYKLSFLPPGEYLVTFTIDGFKTVSHTVNIHATQVALLNVAMQLEEFTGEVSVVAMADTVSAGTLGASTIQQTTLEKLAVSRDLSSAVELSAGVTGENGYFRISGGETWENLFSMNGVVLNENIYGTPRAMYIEDAIQETTVMTSGVSAEYGRFSGGLVNMITRSGGNEYSGSFRVNLTNDKWRGKTPISTERADEINTIYEATSGGPLWRDHLWFFLAGRSVSYDTSMQTYLLNLPYIYGVEERRYEGKLTWSVTSEHRITASYIKTTNDRTNAPGWTPMDLESVDDKTALPQEGLSVNYTGVLTDRLLLEVMYSRNEMTFEGYGGDYADIGRGTVVWDLVTGGIFNSPAWCGHCDPRERDNENLQAKASWFLDAGGASSHDLSIGVDLYDDQVQENFHNTGSGYLIYTYYPQDIRPDEGVVYGVFYPGGWTYIVDTRVLEPSQRSSLKTNSLFVNDTWRLGSHWTFNLGLRYDQNKGENQAGWTVIDDSRLSPRLGASWDIKGDGEWILNASFGRYATTPNIWVADSGSPAGQTVWNGYYYQGPSVFASDLGSNPAAVEAVMDWFFNAGGPGNPDYLAWVSIPGLTPRIGDNLRSPYGDEITVGLSKRLGNRGTLRADYVYREYSDFYAQFMTPGQTGFHQDVGTYDLGIYENESDLLERVYSGLAIRFDYRVGDRWTFGGN
jgi:outer membrane receptor for ferrienterochelin and colicin